MANVIIYTRVSTLIQDTKRQEKELEELCNKEGFNVIKKISEKVSGKNTWKTRELSQVLSLDIKIDGIVVWELSRLGRNTRDVLDIIEELNNKSIWVYSKKENLKTLDENGKESPMSKLLLTILSGIADLERDTIIERSISGLKSSVEEGNWTGGKYLPYGYKRENKKLIIDNEESEIVNLIFHLYQSGLGTSKIAQKLNQNKVQTRFNKTDKNIIINGLEKEPKDFKWVDGTIYSILKNRVYIGEKVGLNKLKDINLKSPSIISKEVFEDVQERLKNTKRTKPQKYFYVLEGKLKCGICGLTYFPHKRANNKDNTYKCLSRRYNNPCSNIGIGIPKLNGGIWTILRTNQKQLENIIEINKHKKDFENEILILKERESITINEIKQDKGKEQKLLDLFFENKLSNDLLNKNFEALKSKLNNLEFELETIKTEIKDKKRIIQKQQSASISLRSIKDDKNILKKTFQKVIDKILVYPINTITQNQVFTNKQDKLVYIEIYTFINLSKPLSFVISQRTNKILFMTEGMNFQKENNMLLIPDAISIDGIEEEYDIHYREIIELESLKN